ncbi:MAG: amino acid ABC transporter permease, partial [Afipia sp.]|nr:amino acid ABC transporter permease [Afipia sp.]
MTERATSFVRAGLVAPVRTTGLVGFARERLFNSPLNIMLTLTSAALLWLLIAPLVKFMLLDAVWTGSDRNACLESEVGRTVGACWPFVQAKFDQFIYGFYPAGERWRVNLTFALGALLLAPLLIPRAP